jgi:RNA polymerase sigma-70 factor (ECF subfamily)
MTDNSDYELIKLIRDKDDKQAFQLLYNKYWDKLFSIALLKIQDEEQVGDLIQDLFVTIWVKRKELNINNNVDLYLYRALKNRITNFFKKKYLTEDKINDFSKNIAGKTDSDAEDKYTYKEIELIISREVASMPDKMKEVFLLSRDEQLSSKKISEMLSLSDQTVRNQISKAIKRIKITLEKYRVIK